MSSEAMDDCADAERLSALVDGELDRSATEAACRRWNSDAQMRSSWHAYQLIGDVLRSDDLAAGAGGNAGFLLSLRARLEAEPVVLAPAPLLAPKAPLRASTPFARLGSRWMLPSAVAAGFFLVIGTFVALRSGDALGPGAPGAPSLAVADASTASGAAIQAVSLGASAEPTSVVMNGQMIRDARLERYLAAHKQFAGSSALGEPWTYLRSATVETDGR